MLKPILLLSILTSFLFANIPLLNQITLPNNTTTTYTYDSQGKKIAQTDALEHSTQWSYKSTGELQTQTLPQGEQKTFSYDATGKQTQVTDYAGKTQKFIYDAYDKLVRIEYVDGSTVTYAYTPSGRVKTITDAQGTIENTYDAMGRLKTQTNPSGETITYSYDNIGNITEIATPTQTISKTYDALNRLSTVTDAQGTVTYTYDAIGRQTQVTFANGVTTSYAYDMRSRITQIEHTNSNGDILQSFTYTLDAVGNRTQIVEHNGRTTNYEYNSVNQLIKEVVTNDPQQNNTTTTFTYDDVGNLKTKTIDGTATDYSYNVNDQLTEQGSITFTYDANGNLVAKDDTTYEYDTKNRLIKVTTPTDTVEYSYDANDNRVAKTTSNGTTTYLIDANTAYAQVITETKENGTEIKYTYGNDLLSDGTHNFLTDALGSTRGLVDNTEQLTDSYSYTPYGEIANHTGDSANSFLFTGEQLDTETDNYFLRARYYSPNSARFISRDTYDGENIDPITLNHYLYAGSNPSMYVDPSGNTYSMSGLSFSMATLGALSAVALPKLPSIGGLAGGFVDNLVDAARVGSTMSLSAMTYVYVMARLRSRSASEDDSPNHTPIQVYGSNNLPRHQEHIADAIAGFGSNWGSPAPSKLRRVTPEINNRNFLSWIGVCGGSPRPKGRNGEDQHCDEYPYNSTSDGGTPAYILGKVSVRLVPADESRAQGRFISKFYNNSVDYGDSFFVMPIGGGVSGFYDKRGMWHDFN